MPPVNSKSWNLFVKGMWKWGYKSGGVSMQIVEGFVKTGLPWKVNRPGETGDKNLLTFRLTGLFGSWVYKSQCPQKWTQNFPQKKYTKSVHKKCQQKVSTKSVHKKCPQKVSTKVPTKSIHKKSPLKVSKLIVHKKCPQQVSTKSVNKKCPQKVSTKYIHKMCPQNVFTKCVH